MKQTRSTIITCAITGSIHTPSMSPYLPVSEEETVKQAVGAAQAGAAVLHLHVRDPNTGKPSADPELFLRVVKKIEAQTDAVLSITTGGSAKMSVEERLEAPTLIGPELCSLNLGTMNFALHSMAEKPREWKHDWEKPFLTSTKDGFFKNTFNDMERIIKDLDARFGTRFEFEAYDVGHLYSLAHLVDRGIVTSKPFVQFVMGILGGIGADADSLMLMKDTATRLFGNDIEWSALPGGRAQMPLCTMAAVMGGNIRVGLEDNLWLGPGELAQTNAQQVRKIASILAELHQPIASAAEARQRLGIRAGS
ncbi:3-keto-5-aminohexanoate cleavage protein [Mesorhizobium tamadayense]|uniref:3-keto-5-aminohexanoate cleavage protein n=1 Tax=Mesorhizobium tamadayense TaxID=425306 RepID=A0A3P3F773_9HYPH|nr:3-keto-5-aminohexanoate cleavage protein [Mesorhizobium tamadayense]RRH94116.1 3-keto-5-aminohexanoate cleavage protein [Mesorhizobium tamadayense]